MRRSAVLLLLASFAIPLFAQQESQLLIPLTTPDGKRAPNVGVGDLTISEDGKPVKIVKIEPIDTPVKVTLSLDNGPSKDFKVHRTWLPAGRWGLENVANLDKVPASGATLVVGVAKVKGATGGPARLIALV
jgi:hypothetical protein